MSTSLILLALSIQKCSQKDLALLLNVSPAQISKWKNGDYMSLEMSEKLSSLIGIGNLNPDFVLQTGSIDSAHKWKRLIGFLAKEAVEDAETGYHTYLLEENEEETQLNWDTFNTLREMGVAIPKTFPSELDFDYEELNTDEDLNACMDKVFSNPYASLIYEIYKSYTDIYGFYAAYVSELIEGLELYDTSMDNIEPELLNLAASKLENVPTMAKNYLNFKNRVNKNYSQWLNALKEQAFLAGKLLRVELLDMVNSSHDLLGHNAEAESLGFNNGRLHPDIYMNELLVGMRVIHQVLPVILKKLEIADDFQLDETDLRLN